MTVYKSILLTTACAFSLCCAAPAMAENFNIPGGDLESALNAYVSQTGAHLIVSEAAVKGTRTKGATGNLSRDDALSKILAGTGFSVRNESGVLAVVRDKGAGNVVTNLQLAQANPASGRIEEVLVTARRREEAIENIPISITALSAEDLKTFGVRNFADLEGVVPGLNLGGGGNGVKRDSSPFIRGIGQRETKVTLDPAVATYIDGVYIGRAAGAMLDVADVGSIQVLRGPQGTLFGKNATGGAISVSLNKPNNNWESNVSVNIGNYGRRDISGMINIPFAEDLVMGRLFISSTNSNGYFTNVVDGAKWGGDNRITGIAQLRVVPTDRITIDILGERTRIRETPRPQRCQYLRDSNFLTTQLDFLGLNFSTFQQSRVDGYLRHEGLCRQSAALKPSQFASDLSDAPGSLLPKGRYWVDTSTAAATANWDVGNFGPLSDFNIKSITAWRKTKQIADEDLDGQAGTFIVRIQPDFDTTTQISEELQFSGKTFNDRLFLSTGFYFFKEKTPQSDLILSAGISPQQTGGLFYGDDAYAQIVVEPAKERLETNNDAYAWYAQADFDITPELQLTGGIRWTRENRWSRYSKVYVDATQLADGVIATGEATGAVQIVAFTEAGSFRPPLEWKFANRQYFYLGPTPGPIDSVLVPDQFVGDELRMSNEAWTPMASLKYKANDSLLQRLGLDQAMIYATYSQGFHSGGVTSGAMDNDSYLRRPDNFADWYNYPADTGIPCVEVDMEGKCENWYIPEPGYGTADPITFRPEKVTNYEVGFKLAALDRRLQANFAAFYMNYTDMQTTAVGSRWGIPVPYIDNVGKSIIKGFEAELVVMPAPEWRIFMNGSYTDAEIKEWNSRIQAVGGAGDPLDSTYHLDRSDERLPRVPRWQLFGSTEYSFNLGTGGTITPSASVRFTSSIYHGFDRGSWVFSQGGYYYNHNGQTPRLGFGRHDDWRDSPADPLRDPPPEAKWTTTSRPTAFLDARLSWISEDGTMEGALWAKNLTNKDDYLVGGIPLVDVLGGTGQVYANPRTFGLTFTYHFGE